MLTKPIVLFGTEIIIELKKTKLEEFAESGKSLSEYCCKFVLEKIVWHKLKFVKNYYKNV